VRLSAPFARQVGVRTQTGIEPLQEKKISKPLNKKIFKKGEMILWEK